MAKKKNKVGRPLAYNLEDIVKGAEAYFNHCEENHEPLTITGLSYWCGFVERKQIYEYAEKEDFAPTIKKYMHRIEYGYELKLHGNSPTGAIYWFNQKGLKPPEEDKSIDVSEEGKVAILREINELAKNIGLKIEDNNQ